MSAAPLRRFESDLNRLVKLPAWERAKVYELANLGLAERSEIEGIVRAQIARDR